MPSELRVTPNFFAFWLATPPAGELCVVLDQLAPNGHVRATDLIVRPEGLLVRGCGARLPRRFYPALEQAFRVPVFGLAGAIADLAAQLDRHRIELWGDAAAVRLHGVDLNAVYARLSWHRRVRGRTYQQQISYGWDAPSGAQLVHDSAVLPAEVTELAARLETLAQPAMTRLVALFGQLPRQVVLP
jgi:hypothetical protein